MRSNYNKFADHDYEFEREKANPWAIRIKFRNIAPTMLCLPLGGFIFCVVWALYEDFEGATYTHCGVKNYLPSISAAIGNFELSQSVWRVCIAIQAPSRFLFISLYYEYLNSIIYLRESTLVKVTCSLHVFENFGLIILTFVSSKDNYWIHEKSFIMFMVCGQVYMVLLCVLLTKYRNISPSSLEKKSLRFKWILLVLNFVAFVLAIYAFIRHNNHCETGMYTIFALLEYIVVLTNMGFHLTVSWDFYDRIITIGPEGLKFLNSVKIF